MSEKWNKEFGWSKNKADALKVRFQAMLRDIQRTKGAMSGQAAEAFFLWRGVRPSTAHLMKTLRDERRTR